MNIYVRDLINVCGGELLIGKEDEIINECFVDSRLVTHGGTFFGIKGNRVNGSDYYKDAFNKGAKVCVLQGKINDLTKLEGKTIVIVNDALDALKQLAAYKRSLFSGKVIGITGSVGKTSTKELASKVLEKRYKVLKTMGNQNSQVGLPLTILRLKDEDVMVLEMGMSNKGEMHNLSMIARPSIAVITNVLTAHIGNFGTRENILKAKLEILDGMNGGALIINADNDLLSKSYGLLKDGFKVYTYGINSVCDLKATNVRVGVNTLFDVDNICDLKVTGGDAFIYNALVAVLTGRLLNIDDAEIKRAICDATGMPHRLQVIEKDGIKIIDDTYNASYDSVKAALEFLKMFKEKKIAVLADMLELGESALHIHKMVGDEVIKNNVNVLLTIGNNSKIMSKYVKENSNNKIKIKHFDDEEKLKSYLKRLIKPGDVILIKGSNGFKLATLVEYLMNV